MLVLLLTGIVSAATLSAATAREMEVIGWNMESGGTDVPVLADQIDRFKGIDVGDFPKCKI